ncbi:MAG TPA: SLC13 family permease [bacterium]|nr:SLC13 family permease [bacterium]
MPTLPLALAIFVLGYALIGARPPQWMPIGRPMGAVLAAALMVLGGVLTPDAALEAVDLNTLVLLWALLLLGVYLREARFFTWAADHFFPPILSPGAVMGRLVWGSGLLSAVLLNDTVAIFGTPLVLHVCKRSGLPLFPYLMALATSANIGSALTLAGNPQNIIVASASKLPFIDYLLLAAPVVAGALALNQWLLRLNYGPLLQVQSPTAHDAEASAMLDQPSYLTPLRARREVLAAISAMVLGWLAGIDLALMAVVAVTGLIVWRRRDAGKALQQLDWGLLVFFTGLFIMMAGIHATGLTRALYERGFLDIAPAQLPGQLTHFALVTLVGSNLFSNVPYVLAVAHNLPPVTELPAAVPLWVTLAITSTFAGNLTLLGSVANLIVAEGARREITIGFRQYLRFGVQTTVASTAWALVVLALEGWFLGWG